MDDLRLKVRNKIYTSGNHIVNTTNNNHAVIVFIGSEASEKLKEYIDNFFGDMLKSQIPRDKLSFLEVGENEMDDLPEKMKQTVEKIDFNQNVVNELYISFVTVMDDDIYKVERKIDVSAIEKLKESALGGFSVEIYYDFYGMFLSSARSDNRQNARKTILNFLDEKNGGVNVRKRIYHQACAGKDYYRCAKSVTFMILINLIKKLDAHNVVNSTAQGEDYTWTTFALYEKNLVSLVVYEMINKLLQNQLKGSETVAKQAICQRIRDISAEQETEMKKLISAGDINYIPIMVRKVERRLTTSEKLKNIFRPGQVSTVELRKENEERSVKDLLEKQKEAVDGYVEENITEKFADEVITDLIRQCTFMESVNNNGNRGLISDCLNDVKKEYSPENAPRQNEYYPDEYNKILYGAQEKLWDTVIEYFEENKKNYVEKVQKHWNEMNAEVSERTKDFAAFQNHFNGMGALDKNVNLMCTYDDILEMIDVQNVIAEVNENRNIYANVLKSYFPGVITAGDIAKRFGNCNINPELGDIVYCLFSAADVECPQNMKLVVDSDWFREHEITILFTAKNSMDDCKNLPFSV